MIRIAVSLAASAVLVAVAASWTPRPSAAPDPRAHHQLVGHPGLDRVFLIGGSTPGDGGHRYFDDIWAWDEKGWSSAGRLPFMRSSHRAVYDPSRASVLLFGGTDGDSVPPAGRGEPLQGLGPGSGSRGRGRPARFRGPEAQRGREAGFGAPAGGVIFFSTTG